MRVLISELLISIRKVILAALLSRYDYGAEYHDLWAILTTTGWS
jgi:hypothetical protein